MSKGGSRETIQAQFVTTSEKLQTYRPSMVGDGGNVMLLLHEMLCFFVMPVNLAPGFLGNGC